MTSYVHGLVQLACALAVAVGVYYLAGLGWALIVGGGSVGVASFLLEMAGPSGTPMRVRRDKRTSPQVGAQR